MHFDAFFISLILLTGRNPNGVLSFFQINLKVLNMMASSLLLVKKTALEVCLALVGCVAGWLNTFAF